MQIWYSYFRYTGRLFLELALFVAIILSNKDWIAEESA